MLTLIITAHRTNYLLETLQSVAAQTSKDFELICCADIHISSAAYELFRKFLPFIQCREKRILQIHGNGTAGFTRNVGFAHAHTEWVAYLDGDDMLMPDAIETVLQTIETTNVDILSSGILRLERDGTITEWTDSLNYYPSYQLYLSDPEKTGTPVHFNHFQVIRKKLWELYPYNEETNGEDIDFMLHQLINGYYLKIPKYLYCYRNTPNSFASEEKYTDKDICTQRYRSGYYQELVIAHKSNYLRSNLRGNSK